VVFASICRGHIKALEKISRRIGFTQTEIKVILCIIIALVAGLIVNFIKKSKNNNDYLEFNYKTEDSLYNAALSNSVIKDSLSLNRRNIVQARNKKVIPVSKIINMNSAPVPELILLPGIGEKTAQAIIEYRKKHGKFSSIEEILNIKGIGIKKLDKIKMFISIE
jgi:competence protein ComEA